MQDEVPTKELLEDLTNLKEQFERASDKAETARDRFSKLKHRWPFSNLENKSADPGDDQVDEGPATIFQKNF